MNKIVKNSIVAFTMLCVVVLVVFLIELLVINSEKEDGGEPGPTHTADSPANSGDVPDDGKTSPGSHQPGSDGQAEDQDGQDGQDEAYPEPTGTRHEIGIYSGVKLIVYADVELFEFTEPESEEIRGVFTFKGSGDAVLEVMNAYMPQGVSAFATSFLSVNYEVDGSTDNGEQAIGKSPLNGISVTGEKDGIAYEAWVLVFPDAEVEGTGLVIIISYQNETQRLNLYDILDSLDIISPQPT